MRVADVVRVFTRGDAGGNLLGVITDVHDLDDASMQAIAAHLGYSETIFVDRSTEPFSVRIFTPSTELPFAGHPLVGAAWSLGGTGTMRCGVGDIPFEVSGDVATVGIRLSSEVTRADAGAIASAARLPRPRRAWWVKMPIPYLIIDAETPEAVEAADPDIEALGQTDAAEATMLTSRVAATVTARFFAPGLGVDEDPATGSAAVAFASMRYAEGERQGALEIRQGDRIGFPSTIRIVWIRDDARLAGSVRREPSRDIPW